MVAPSRRVLRLVAIFLTLSPSVVQSFQPQPSAATTTNSLRAGTRSQTDHFVHRHILHPKSIVTKLDAQSPPKTRGGSSNSRGGGGRPNRRKKRKRVDNRRELMKEIKNPNELETWRIYGVDVDPDALGESSSSSSPLDRRKGKGSGDVDDSSTIVIPPERSYLLPPVLASLSSRLRIKPEEERDRASDSSPSSSSECDDVGNGEIDSSRETGIVSLPPPLKDARVVRRSLDARRRRGAPPKYSYVIDVVLTKEAAMRGLKLSHKPGRTERMGGTTREQQRAVERRNDGNTDEDETEAEEEGGGGGAPENNSKPKILIVGAGPAGLFCALSLASSGLFTPIVLERGQPVEARGKSIGALIHRRSIDPNSNFSFGEGGAGTWSDGKLTTRIGRNSGPVRHVLETLVKYGAPDRIMVEGAPHLGTDNLVRLLRNMRQDLRAMGGEIRFGARVDKFHIEDGTIKGVDARCTPTKERIGTGTDKRKEATSSEGETTKTLYGDAVVLATGHSARDVYYELHDAGVELEAKGFAVGFRIEHPQRLINEIQYGKDWGGRVFTRRASTDAANKEHFEKDGEDPPSHAGTLPVASYRLATNDAWDGAENRGAYSFCQCPGGQIVPSSTEEGELCINGMSFSKRDSLWANSALVVTVSPDDPILEPYRRSHGTLAGLEFQRDMERKAYKLGGGGMRAPVQRLTDFVSGKMSESESIPQSSYRLGVESAACHDIYPQPLYDALVHAITHHFDKQMPGFLCDQALLHGVETRTSSPVRVLRDGTTLQASGVDNMFPSGEGAGFAGGIVSAAVDGLLVANAIKTKFLAHDKSSLFDEIDKVSIGFDY